MKISNHVLQREIIESYGKVTMRSERYRWRRAKIKFRTQQISIRGFARELKSRLMEGRAYFLDKQEYTAVADTFAERISEHISETVYDEAHLSSQGTFVDSSCFSKWWNGKKYPNDKNRKQIDRLFPGLTAKWFDRSNFKNRMQLHLASLDLFHLSRNCSCQVEKQPEKESQSHCEHCLFQALKEAEWILNAIHNDWRPVHTGYLKAFDVCISGPQRRSGLNVAKNLLESKLNPKATDHREQIDYDLSLGGTSFIGLPLPKEIVNSYQDENPFSIVLFLFLLVGLDLKTKSEYRDDLILDFMTALNCAGLLLYIKHGSLFTSSSDFIEEKLREMLLHASEYFYDQPFDLNEQLFSYEELCKQSEEKMEPSDCSIVHPMTHFSCHPGFELSELFFEILRFVVKDQNIGPFMENLEELSYSNTYAKSKIDDYLKSPYLQIFKSLESARERYLKLFDIIGYSRAELIAELNKTVCNPISRRLKSGSAPQKKSAYAGKMTVMNMG